MANLPMRLAFRREGSWWNCYVAQPDTMDRAILLATIRMHLVEASPRVKTEFMSCMQAALTVAMKDMTGAQIEWPNPPQPAPETERSGNA